MVPAAGVNQSDLLLYRSPAPTGFVVCKYCMYSRHSACSYEVLRQAFMTFYVVWATFEMISSSSILAIQIALVHIVEGWLAFESMHTSKLDDAC